MADMRALCRNSRRLVLRTRDNRAVHRIDTHLAICVVLVQVKRLRFTRERLLTVRALNLESGIIAPGHLRLRHSSDALSDRASNASSKQSRASGKSILPLSNRALFQVKELPYTDGSRV